MEIERIAPKDGSKSRRVRFDSTTYYIYPGGRGSDRRYYASSKGKRLHVAVWEYYHGPVPEGCHIHHKNGNTIDNRLENLECLSAHEHLSKNTTDRVRRAARENIKIAQVRAKAWHSSRAGLAWHRQHGIDTMAAREPAKLVCRYCGGGFKSLRPDAKYCCAACKNKAHYHDGSRLVERTCVVCGKSWLVDKYAASRCCSVSCAATLRWRERRAGI